MAGTKTPPKWINSQAKAYLLNLLTEGKIPEDMAPKRVYEKHCKGCPEFALFGDKNFCSRLRSLRKKVSERSDRAARDSEALARDRMIYPRPCQDGFGLPYWPDSDAKKLLERDIDEENHLNTKTYALWMSKPEHYESIPCEVFVKRIHQEVKTRKFHTYVDDKRKEMTMVRFHP